MLLLIPALGAQAGENPTYVAALRTGLDLMRADQWEAAIDTAGGPGTIRRDIILWHYLRASKGRFAQAQAFLARRADWPGLKLLRKRVEASIPADTPPGEVLAFFADQPPQTGTGVLLAARALVAEGRADEAEAMVVLAWFSMLMDADEEQALLAEYAGALGSYHWQRLDMLLWRGETGAARRMLPLVDRAHQKLAEARIWLRGQKAGVDGAIEAVPGALRDDPGLAYERFLWRASKGRNQSAVDLMLERSQSAEALGEPGRWGSWRRTLARWSMRAGKARQAYRLAANHYIEAGSNRNDLEWLAGYIALRKLNEPEAALRHFKAFR
ncbi:MAG TPA: lytic transglycosylase domain-containing protein, partial [Aliiroseovarius sp.]|nr:lytic transglycosylase domain-containing protein [Aliiroseovarius sp.]